MTLRPSHIPYLKELRNAGMTMARLNGSHNSVDWHRRTIQTIRKEISNIPILLDIPGRKLRLAVDRIVPVHAGEILDLPLPTWIPDDTTIVFDDGKITGTVILGKNTICDEGSADLDINRPCYTFVEDDKRSVQFHQDGQLRPQIGINIPSMSMQGPLLTPRDLEIIDLAQTELVDYVGLSFIESSKLIHAVHQLCDRPCAAKIETTLALQNLDDICQYADMIIVARGDLSVECGLFNVIKNQKHILQIAKKHNKISIVGTGLLALYPPQQSTIADVQNAILDGVDYLLVSNDLPDGQNSIEVIHTLRIIIF